MYKAPYNNLLKFTSRYIGRAKQAKTKHPGAMSNGTPNANTPVMAPNASHPRIRDSLLSPIPKPPEQGSHRHRHQEAPPTHHP